jgi:hypothetical protein
VPLYLVFRINLGIITAIVKWLLWSSAGSLQFGAIVSHEVNGVDASVVRKHLRQQTGDRRLADRRLAADPKHATKEDGRARPMVSEGGAVPLLKNCASMQETMHMICFES